MARLLSGQGKVHIITGAYDLPALSPRIQGFKEVIKAEYPLIEMVDMPETKEEKALTFQIALSFLENVRDLKGIYITGGPADEVGKAVKLLKKAGHIKKDSLIRHIKVQILDGE